MRRPSHRATPTETATSPRPSATIAAHAAYTPDRSSDVGTDATTTSSPRGVRTGTRESSPSLVGTAEAVRFFRAVATAVVESALSGSWGPSRPSSGSTTTTSGPRLLRSLTLREMVAGSSSAARSVATLCACSRARAVALSEAMLA